MQNEVFVSTSVECHLELRSAISHIGSCCCWKGKGFDPVVALRPLLEGTGA